MMNPGIENGFLMDLASRIRIKPSANPRICTTLIMESLWELLIVAVMMERFANNLHLMDKNFKRNFNWTF